MTTQVAELKEERVQLKEQLAYVEATKTKALTEIKSLELDLTCIKQNKDVDPQKYTELQTEMATIRELLRIKDDELQESLTKTQELEQKLEEVSQEASEWAESMQGPLDRIQELEQRLRVNKNILEATIAERENKSNKIGMLRVWPQHRPWHAWKQTLRRLKICDTR